MKVALDMYVLMSLECFHLSVTPDVGVFSFVVCCY